MSNLQMAAVCLAASSIILSAGVIHLNLRKRAAMENTIKQKAEPAITLIQPTSVERDEMGCWWHPGMPEFDEGDDDKFKEWKEQQCIETTWVEMQDEVDWGHPYFEQGLCDFSFWTPNPPQGEGWFTLYIADSEDGPVWVWARRKEGGAA